MPTISHDLAAFAADLSYDTIPDKVREKAKVTLLHNLGVALAGRSLLVAPYQFAADRHAAGETGPARLLVDGTQLQPETAAFVNATLIHARTQDDVYFPSLTHLGAVTIPAALAVAEEHDLAGRDVLVALVAAYEVAAAIGEGFAYETTPRGFRATGIYGVFGPAVAATLLLGGGRDEVANALGIAASFAAGLNQTWVAGTQEWQFQVGAAARNGILAARLAMSGGTGAPDALEGRAGFYAAFAGRPPERSVATDLGTTWRSLDVTYKPYPVCAILQGPVTAIAGAAGRDGVTADHVRSVRLHLTPAEASYPGTDSTGPFTDVGGTLMSAAFCLSVALIEGTVRAADLKRFDDAEVMSLVRRTEVVADESLPPRCSRAVIETTTGDQVTAEFEHTATTFNWSRDEVSQLLASMVGEMPFDQPAIDQLAAAVLAADERSAREIVDCCVRPDRRA